MAARMGRVAVIAFGHECRLGTPTIAVMAPLSFGLEAVRGLFFIPEAGAVVNGAPLPPFAVPIQATIFFARLTAGETQSYLHNFRSGTPAMITGPTDDAALFARPSLLVECDPSTTIAGAAPPGYSVFTTSFLIIPLTGSPEEMDVGVAQWWSLCCSATVLGDGGVQHEVTSGAPLENGLGARCEGNDTADSRKRTRE